MVCVVLQIIVFMCYGIMLNKWVLQTYQLDFMKSPLVYHPGHRAQVWRFFSYMFMHVGYVELLLLCPADRLFLAVAAADETK